MLIKKGKKGELNNLLFLLAASFCLECHECTEFKCWNNLCVLSDQQCDNENQCGDNSDEMGCFQCLNSGLLVKPGAVCNGVDDCGDNSDEARCPGNSG